VRVERSGEGNIRQWCEFNVSILTQEGRRQDRVLLEDEAEATSLFWLNRKEA
jgi:hypothetical protein